jgi:hypothetical protein
MVGAASRHAHYHFKEQTARSLCPRRRHPPYLQLNPLTGLFTWKQESTTRANVLRRKNGNSFVADNQSVIEFMILGRSFNEP